MPDAGMICGIDVGLKGAVAMLYPEGTLYVEDMPTLGKEVNGAALANIFKEFPPSHVFIESVNSHLMGRQSAFNFGQGVGVIKGVLGALTIPYTLVTPAKWKSDLKLVKSKDAARALATNQFPLNADNFKRKKDDGRAESALIAVWGRNFK